MGAGKRLGQVTVVRSDHEIMIQHPQFSFALWVFWGRKKALGLSFHGVLFKVVGFGGLRVEGDVCVWGFKNLGAADRLYEHNRRINPAHPAAHLSPIRNRSHNTPPSKDVM